MLKPVVGLTAGQGLRTGMAATLRTSLAVLKMPAESLLDDIAREAGENPCLVADWPARPVAFPAAEAIAAREGVLAGLSHQIGMQRLAPAERRAALHLAGELRDDGFLDVPLSDIAAQSGLAPADLLAGLRAIQRCEPAGIGARDLPEYVALRLADAGLPAGTATAAAQCLEDFAEGRWARLGRTLGLPRAELERIAALLRRIGARPRDADGTAPDPAIRLPELVVSTDARGRLAVGLSEAGFPRLRTVRPAATDAGAPIAAMARRAERFVADIARRRATLLRIGQRLIADQETWFLTDPPTLAPVTRAEAALALGIHPSTLGRAIHAKSLIWNGRVLPLAMFFPRAVPAAEGALSTFEVQRRIRAAIRAEDPLAPLPDAGICDLLRKEGVDISRRTVAKYRKCMRIPTVYGRRRRKAPS